MRFFAPGGSIDDARALGLPLLVVANLVVRLAHRVVEARTHAVQLVLRGARRIPWKPVARFPNGGVPVTVFRADK